jgi:ketosteroid isomerase-like protein
MSVRENVEKLVALVQRGEFLEAIETFYAADATMQENTSQPPRVGLQALLAGERKALERFKILHAHHAASYVVDGNRAAINWIFEVTEQSGIRYILDEIAYQEWQDGKIIRERFYYDPAQRSTPPR